MTEIKGEWLLTQDEIDNLWDEYEKNDPNQELEIITEDFVEMVANFYMNDRNRKLAFELWRSIEKRLLKGEPNDQ